MSLLLSDVRICDGHSPAPLSLSFLSLLASFLRDMHSFQDGSQDEIPKPKISHPLSICLHQEDYKRIHLDTDPDPLASANDSE
jgi:hypothetical protein